MIKEQIAELIYNNYIKPDRHFENTPLSLAGDIIRIFEQANPIQAGEDGLVKERYIEDKDIECFCGNSIKLLELYRLAKEAGLIQVQKALDKSQAKQKQAEAVACKHNITGKLIEIAGKQYKEFGTKEYEPDYSKLEQIVHKQVTGEGINYCYLEYLICCECDTILEKNEVYTV